MGESAPALRSAARPDAPGGGAPGAERGASGRLSLRVLSAALFLPAFVLIAERGGPPFLAFVAAIAILGGRETFALAGRLGLSGARRALAAAAYPGVLAGTLWLLRAGGAGVVFFLFLATWACDTTAYFTGRAFGRTPLAPTLSPKKTREGAVAGLVAAAIAGWLAAGWLGPQRSSGEGLAVGAILGVVGQAGDLFESLLKRSAGVKDSSTLIPGHGGVLDRFDSVLANAPVLLFLLFLLDLR
jgi:phosphatidate cytidylyltransferase